MFANTLPDGQVYLKGWSQLQYIIVLLSRSICIKFDYRKLSPDQLFFFIIFVTVSEIMLGSESQFSKLRLNYFSVLYLQNEVGDSLRSSRIVWAKVVFEPWSHENDYSYSG